jgi:tetratricopeptide (TPR) repeat protein
MSTLLHKLKQQAASLCLASVLALAAAVTAAGQSLPDALQPLFSKGVEAQRANRLQEAEAAFLEVLRSGGKVAFVHNNLGAVYQQMGDHSRAIFQFREALRLQPDYAAPQFLLGASLLAQGKAGEAARQLEQALKLDPQQFLGRLELAKAYELAGNPMGMLDQYRKLTEAQPDNPEYVYQLGRAYLKLSEWALQRVKELNPRSPRLYQSLALNYHIQGKDELALRALQEAVALGPKLPELHLALAEIYFRLGNLKEARNAVEKELAIMPVSQAARALKQKLDSSNPPGR